MIVVTLAICITCHCIVSRHHIRMIAYDSTTLSQRVSATILYTPPTPTFYFPLPDPIHPSYESGFPPSIHPYPPHMGSSRQPGQPRLGPLPHQRLQPQILPRALPLRLRRARYPKGRVLVRHDVVFVFRVRRLVLGGHVDGFVGEVRGAVEFFEEVGVTGLGEVDVGVGGVFRHDRVGLWKGWRKSR